MYASHLERFPTTDDSQMSVMSDAEASSPSVFLSPVPSFNPPFTRDDSSTSSAPLSTPPPSSLRLSSSQFLFPSEVSSIDVQPSSFISFSQSQIETVFEPTQSDAASARPSTALQSIVFTPQPSISASSIFAASRTSTHETGAASVVQVQVTVISGSTVFHTISESGFSGSSAAITPTPSNSSASSHSDGSLIGPIIGTAIGAILVAFICWFLIRRCYTSKADTPARNIG